MKEKNRVVEGWLQRVPDYYRKRDRTQHNVLGISKTVGTEKKTLEANPTAPPPLTLYSPKKENPPCKKK